MSGTIGPQGQQMPQGPQIPGGGMQATPFTGGQMSPQLMAMLTALARQHSGGVPQLPMSGLTPGMMPPPGQPTPGQPPAPMAPPPGQPMPQGPPPQAFTGPPPQLQTPPPMGSPAMSQNLQMFGNAANGQRRPAGQGMRMSPAEMQSMGRYGDSVLAHLTPGEMVVPREAQTPQVKSALGNAFGQLGVQPSMFSAGSPQSSTNPMTGANEYSILGALLPVLGAIGGTIVAPGAGTAIGGALGGAAGGALDKTGPAGIALGALGGGVGGLAGGFGGGMLGDAATSGAAAMGGDAATSGAAAMGTDAAAQAGTNAATQAASMGAAASPFGTGTGAAVSAAPLGAPGAAASGAAPFSAGSAAPMGGMSASPAVNPGAVYAGGATPAQIQALGLPAGSGATPTSSSILPPGALRAGMASGIGASLGQAMAPQPQSNGLPPGFNNPMPPMNPALPIGGRAAVQAPTFANYNPYAAVTGANGGTYNFYPR